MEPAGNTSSVLILDTEVNSSPPGYKLFFFSFPDDWTEEHLSEYFQPRDNLLGARVREEVGTGRARGFGFVSYGDRVSAATAIEIMQGYKILGKRLKVEFKKNEINDNQLMSGLKTSSAGVAPLQKEGYPGDERLIGYVRQFD